MKKLICSLIFLSMMILPACGGGGGGGEETTTIPDVPTNVRPMAGRGHMSGVSGNYVILRWDASSGATSYTIYYSTTDSTITTSSNKVTGVTDTYHLFTDVPADFKLWFAVTASNSAGESDLSSVKHMAVQIAATGQTTSYAANDDGALQKGVSWSSDRFIYYSNPAYYDTLLDTMTGLMWPSTNYYISITSNTWQNAFNTYYWPISNIGGYTDWRIPNRRELMSMIDYSSGTSDLPSSENYWTSTTDAQTTANAWPVDMASGIISTSTNKLNTCYILPVRDAYGLASTEIARTGQTTPYDSGNIDDGGLQKGVIWPNPRFTDNGNTVTDNLTGLMWLKNATAITNAIWPTAVSTAAACTTDGYHDWRLPNVRELESLLDMSKTNPCIPNSSYLLNCNHIFWTSTTQATSTNSAWCIDFSNGSINVATKLYNSYYVWPVRSTQ